MTEDLAKLEAKLNALADLPPVLDDSDGPTLVNASTVGRLATEAWDIVGDLVREHERMTARLDRYARLKLYARELEQKLMQVSNRLRVVREVTSL